MEPQDDLLAELDWIIDEYGHHREGQIAQRARDKIAALYERLGPRGLVVVQIDNSGHYVSEVVANEIAALRNEAKEYQRAELAAQSMLNLALEDRDASHNVAQRKLEDWRIGVAPVVRAKALQEAAQRCRSMADNYEGVDDETCRMCAAAILALIDKSVSDLDQGESDAV